MVGAHRAPASAGDQGVLSYLVIAEEIRAPGPAELLAEPVPEPRAPHIIDQSDVAAIFSYLEARAATDAAAAMDLALYGIAYHGALLISEAIGLTLDAVSGGPAVIKLEVIGRRGEESQVTLDGDAAAWMGAWLAIRPAPARAEHRPFVFIHPRTGCTRRASARGTGSSASRRPPDSTRTWRSGSRRTRCVTRTRRISRRARSTSRRCVPRFASVRRATRASTSRAARSRGRRRAPRCEPRRVSTSARARKQA